MKQPAAAWSGTTADAGRFRRHQKLSRQPRNGTQRRTERDTVPMGFPYETLTRWRKATAFGIAQQAPVQYIQVGWLCHSALPRTLGQTMQSLAEGDRFAQHDCCPRRGGGSLTLELGLGARTDDAATPAPGQQSLVGGQGFPWPAFLGRPVPPVHCIDEIQCRMTAMQAELKNGQGLRHITIIPVDRRPANP